MLDLFMHNMRNSSHILCKLHTSWLVNEIGIAMWWRNMIGLGGCLVAKSIRLAANISGSGITGERGGGGGGGTASNSLYAAPACKQSRLHG